MFCLTGKRIDRWSPVVPVVTNITKRNGTEWNEAERTVKEKTAKRFGTERNGKERNASQQRPVDLWITSGHDSPLRRRRDRRIIIMHAGALR